MPAQQENTASTESSSGVDELMTIAHKNEGDCDHPWASLNTEVMDSEAFIAARACALIDYITIDVRGLGKIPLPRSRYKRASNQITIQNPRFPEIAQFKGQKIIRIELTIDLWPNTSWPDNWHEQARRATYRHLSRRIWPFNTGSAIFPSYRVYADQTKCQRPFSINRNDGYIEPRLPDHNETLYIGDRPGFTRFNALPNHNTCGAQMRAYIKRTDNKNRLPSSEWRTRIEVTLWDYGLSSNDIETVSDLFTISYREKFSKYFNLIDPTKAPSPSKQIANLRRRFKFCNPNILLTTKQKIFEASIRDGGAISLLPERSQQVKRTLNPTRRGAVEINNFVPTRSHSDTRANKKLGEALDNLTRKAKQECCQLSQR